jgi:hypothetical protein
MPRGESPDGMRGRDEQHGCQQHGAHRCRLGSLNPFPAAGTLDEAKSEEHALDLKQTEPEKVMASADSSSAPPDGTGLALAMALHHRLGCESPLALMTSDMLQRIVQLCRLSCTRWVVAITVRTGLLVDCLAFHYSNGSDLCVGGRGGQERPFFKLACGEYISKLRGRRGLYLDAVEFETSLGRRSPWYGSQSGGQPFEFSAPAGHEIYSFDGTQKMPWLSDVLPVTRKAPKADWAADIALMCGRGFEADRSFICRPAPLWSHESWRRSSASLFRR